MTVAIWPETLPLPLRDGYQGGLGDGRQASQPTVGPPHIRRRSSTAARPVTLNFSFTADERARFERFWTEDVVDGSMTFWLPNFEVNGQPLTTVAGEVLVDAAESAELLIEAWWLVQFAPGQAPNWVPKGIKWRCSVQVVILP